MERNLSGTSMCGDLALVLDEVEAVEPVPVFCSSGSDEVEDSLS